MVVYRLTWRGDLTLSITKRIASSIAAIGPSDLYLTPNLRIAVVHAGFSVPNENGLRPHFIGRFDYTISDEALHSELRYAVDEVCPASIEHEESDGRYAPQFKMDVPIEEDLIDDSEEIALVDTLHSLRYGYAHTNSDDAFGVVTME